MSLYLGENLISGQATLVGESRNIGQIIPSAIPLTDAGLHLLDGSLILGGGIYSAFVDYIADLYENTPVSGYKSNVNIVGNLTNNNGVLSGFSASNYATTPQVFNPASNTWEQVWCFTTGSSVTSTQSIVGGNTGFANPLFRITSSGYINMLCSTNNSSWDVAITGSSALSVNTKYYVKGSFNGTEYKLELSTDKESFTTVGVVSSTSSIYIVDKQKLGNNNAGNETFLGSIDLKESYIDINGQRWWTGAEEIKPCFCTEAQWQTSVTQYGVCGKFVYDSVNNTVRLPKVTGKLDGTTDVNALGDLEPLFVKLPNITGYFNILKAEITSATGAFSTGSNRSGNGANVVTGKYCDANFNASRSSSVYSGNGTDTTIHEQAVNVLYYIVIATSTKTDIQVDIDEIATDLNGKADRDFDNTIPSQRFKNNSINWVVPSYPDVITVTGTTTFIAPTAGLIYMRGQGNRHISFTINGQTEVGLAGGSATNAGWVSYAYLAQNDVCQIVGGPNVVYFYPAKGAN